MEQCSRCKDFTFVSDPKCSCEEYKIIDEDGEEHEVWAVNDHSAAVKFAEWSNVEGDYHLMNETVEITVNGKAFNISAEPEIYYSAREAH